MNSSAACTTELAENGRALVLTLENPPDNAVTPELLETLGKALDRLSADAGPDVLVLIGGGQVFSKGYDVDRIRAHRDRAAHWTALLADNDAVSRLADCAKPTVAAVNGHCLGAGLELALACHFRLAAEKVRLGLPELAQGLLPGLGGIDRLVRLVGRARALELVALGEFVTAEEAHRIGLVNRVLPRQAFWQHVLSFVRGLLSVDQRLVREVIRLAHASTRKPPQDCLADAIETIGRQGVPAR